MREIEKVLHKFVNKVVREAKRYKRGSKLTESIKSEVDVFPNSFSVRFFMNEYGLFRDMGVSGTERKYNTDFSYTRDSKNFGPALVPWVRGTMRPRDAGGRFKKANYLGIGIAIANIIKKKGIKPSLFFTKPFERAFKLLPEEVVEGYGLELDKAIDSWLTKPNYTGTKTT